MSEDLNLRTTFNHEAELYRAIRPSYPEELFDQLVKTTKLQPGSNLLEIAPGTGQATEPLAKRGYRITAIELGANLAQVARTYLAKYKNVNIINSSFEDVQLPLGSFDLIYVATAFHWIDPKVKFSKPFQLLKNGGHLAIIDTKHVSDEKGDRFFFASQPIYQKYTPIGKYDPNFRLTPPLELKADKVDENFFTTIFFHSFPIIINYSAKEYSQLLNTYSSTISLTLDQRARFLKEIEQLIDEKFGGTIQKHFSMTLTIAKKNS